MNDFTIDAQRRRIRSPQCVVLEAVRSDLIGLNDVLGFQERDEVLPERSDLVPVGLLREVTCFNPEKLLLSNPSTADSMVKDLGVRTEEVTYCLSAPVRRLRTPPRTASEPAEAEFSWNATSVAAETASSSVWAPSMRLVL